MSVRPIDSLSIAVDRLKAAMEEYRAALAEVAKDGDAALAPPAEHESEEGKAEA